MQWLSSMEFSCMHQQYEIKEFYRIIIITLLNTYFLLFLSIILAIFYSLKMYNYNHLCTKVLIKKIQISNYYYYYYYMRRLVSKPAQSINLKKQYFAFFKVPDPIYNLINLIPLKNMIKCWIHIKTSSIQAYSQFHIKNS